MTNRYLKTKTPPPTIILFCIFILACQFHAGIFASNNSLELNLEKSNQTQNADTLAFTRSRSDSCLTVEGRWAHGPVTVIDTQDDIACFNSGDNLIIADISDPLNIVELGTILYPQTINDIVLQDNFAYIVVEDDGLYILDITDPQNPKQAWKYKDKYDNYYRIAVRGTQACFDGSDLVFLDITDPYHPVIQSIPERIYGSNPVFYNEYCIARGYYGTYVLDMTDPVNIVVADTLNEMRNFTINNHFLYTFNYDSLKIMDISNLSRPVLLSTTPTEEGEFVVIHEQLAFVYNDFRELISIFDISNPSQPKEIGHFEALDDIKDISIEGQYAYVAANTQGLRVVDISDPSNISITGTYLAHVYDCLSQDNYAYALRSDRLQILDISDPSSPQEASAFFMDIGWDIEEGSPQIVFKDNYVYISNLNLGLDIINVSNPQSPTQAAHLNLEKDVGKILFKDKYAYLRHSKGFYVIDISDPTHPSLIKDAEFVSWSKTSFMAISENKLFLYNDYPDKEIKIIDISNPANPVLAGSFATHGEITGMGAYSHQFYYSTWGYDVDWQYENPGIYSVDFSDPVNTVETHYLYLDDPDEMLINQNILYAAYDNEFGMFNISDPDTIIKMDKLETESTLLSVSNDYAFLKNDWENELVIVDLSDHSNPTEINAFDKGDYNTLIGIYDNCAYLLEGERPYTGIRSIDISDPLNPVDLDVIQLEAWNRIWGVYKLAAFDEDKIYLSGRDGLYVIDISNPSDLKHIKTYDWPMALLTPGDIEIVDHHIYALLRGYEDEEEGLYIFDTSSSTELIQKGFFHLYDTYILAMNNSKAYAARGSQIKIIDVSDVSQPGLISTIDLEGGRYDKVDDIAFINHYLYVAKGGGLEIVDVSNPESPELVTVCTTYLLSSRYHDYVESIDIRNNYAITYFDNYGLVLFDISDPAYPEQIGFYSSREMEDATCIIQGDYIFSDCRTLDVTTECGLYVFKYDPTNSEVINASHSDRFQLTQNYPNPFNPETTISYTLPRSMQVKLTVYDILGRTVKVLINQKMDAGMHTAHWDASHVASGVYFYRLETESFNSVKKCLLLR